MSIFGDGLREGVRLLLAGDREVLDVLGRTLYVSGAGTALAVVAGMPAGAALALARFRGRGLLLALANTGMGLPPVVVGLALAMAFWRTGPLGGLDLLYTPAAMVVAQTVLAFPVVVALTAAAYEGLPPAFRTQAEALGATRVQVARLLAREARLGLLAAVAAGFGAAVSEVGAVLIVGGNLRGETRVLTTAIVLETRRGRFEVAVAFAAILLAIAFAVNAALTYLQSRQDRTRAWERRRLA